ncbi:activator of Hsp90 ATPase [Thelephora terrestris]|uniref:Activator of Hsp90 ATPase n=1 Tax=Thelephora terrestris TaxID=56493 RepID=A0A9P6HQJ0_9AGAM|nr:activator of Hsp90 ATPase [Thelephora terrestris]
MSVVQPMSNTTANWHWKNKNIGPWARQWFQRELVAITITGDGDESVQVTGVTDVDGDVELGQRKSKLITIYDVKIELEWSGKASDGTEASGKLVIPEVSHEVTLDGLSEYTYNWTLTTKKSKPVDSLYQLARQRLPVALEAKFAEFPAAIIETHGKDLTVSSEPSRTGTPVQATDATSATSTATAATPAPKSVARSPPPKKTTVNTSTVEVEATFMAAADDLFSLFTDERRIPIWTRAPAKSDPTPGSEYSLFGGGVKGKYVSLDAPKQIVQTWSLQSSDWPSGHEATFTTTLIQSSESTTVKFTLKGVPLGREDEIKRNIEGYYVHGLKSIGLGSEL